MGLSMKTFAQKYEQARKLTDWIADATCGSSWARRTTLQSRLNRVEHFQRVAFAAVASGAGHHPCRLTRKNTAVNV